MCTCMLEVFLLAKRENYALGLVLSTIDATVNTDFCVVLCIHISYIRPCLVLPLNFRDQGLTTSSLAIMMFGVLIYLYDVSLDSQLRKVKEQEQ